MEHPEMKNQIRENRSRKTRMRLWRFLGSGLLIVVAALVIVFLTDGRHPKFYMPDGQEITTAFGEPYEDRGVTARLTGRLFGDGHKTLTVECSGTVDTGSLGRYVLTYSTRYLGRNNSCTRTVTVKDLTPPELILLHRDGYQPSWMRGYEEEGYTATDNVDGDVTHLVRREDFGNMIRYTVSDHAGNRTEAVRTLEYAVSKPILSLNGEAEMHIPAGFDFEDPGCEAFDSSGNDMSRYVQVSGEVIPYRVGTYELIYSISNANGDSARTMRSVTVEPRPKPKTVEPVEKTIYLTFNGGPGPYTDRLLDILKQNDVSATFFVTCLDPLHFDCIGRAGREGHAVGILSASHDYRKIYAGEDAFFEDFNQVQELIMEQTGAGSRICRFPGGSDNTVSGFNQGIMTALAEDVENLGYQYFDWDVTSEDTAEKATTDSIYSKLVGELYGRHSAVVLLHDTRENSIAAVEMIIKWGLNHGYRFQALDLISPPAHHDIVN